MAGLPLVSQPWTQPRHQCPARAGGIGLGDLPQLHARSVEVGTQTSLSPAWSEPPGGGRSAPGRDQLPGCAGRLTPAVLRGCQNTAASIAKARPCPHATANTMLNQDYRRWNRSRTRGARLDLGEHKVAHPSCAAQYADVSPRFVPAVAKQFRAQGQYRLGTHLGPDHACFPDPGRHQPLAGTLHGPTTDRVATGTGAVIAHALLEGTTFCVFSKLSRTLRHRSFV